MAPAPGVLPAVGGILRLYVIFVFFFACLLFLLNLTILNTFDLLYYYSFSSISALHLASQIVVSKVQELSKFHKCLKVPQKTF